MNPMTHEQIDAIANEHLKYQIQGADVSGVYAFAHAIQEAVATIPGRDFRCKFAKQLHDQMAATGDFESEGFGFAQEVASQYGADHLDADATILRISARELYVLMRAMGYRHKTSADGVEVLRWNTDGSLPDADELVLVEGPDPGDVWGGCYDGEQWLTQDGMPVDVKVLAWAEWPAGSKGGA